MKRTEWTFDVPVADLRESVEKLVEHHKQGHADAKKEMDAVLEEIRESGLEVKEERGRGRAMGAPVGGRLPDPAFSNNTTYVVRSGIAPELQEKLENVSEALNYHKQNMRDYQRWLAIFNEEDENRMLPLDYTDILYFGVVVV